ncbi:ribosomal protein S18 [Sparassis latifolia]
MFSAANVFRSAARQPRWLNASPAAVIAPRRTIISTPEPESLSDVSDILRSSANAQGTANESSESGTPTPVNPEDAVPPLITGHERFKGFRTNKVKPNQLSRNDRTATRRPVKPPLLGPSAKESRELDIFYQLNIDPLHECQNSSLMSHFVTEMGRIMPRAQTKLTWKNQRKLGKAIRRAKMMGVIPILSKRPLDLLQR